MVDSVLQKKKFQNNRSNVLYKESNKNPSEQESYVPNLNEANKDLPKIVKHASVQTWKHQNHTNKEDGMVENPDINSQNKVRIIT